MKNLSKVFFPLFIVAILTGCVEKGPVIDLGDRSVSVDTTYVLSTIPDADDKVVLMEEFTGATCPFCPAGNKVASELLDEHPDQLILVAIHNDNSMAEPYPGEEDLRTEEGIALSQKLGASSILPVAAVDRFLDSNQSQEAVTKSKWANLINKRLKVQPKVNVELENDYNSTTRELRVKATVTYLETVTEESHISLMITESNINSPQMLLDGSKDDTYIHDHILRDMITQVFGAKTHETTEAGRVIVREYLFEIPENWVPENLDVVGFINMAGSTNEVLQAAEAPVL